jgi:hypothetical protein
MKSTGAPENGNSQLPQCRIQHGAAEDIGIHCGTGMGNPDYAGSIATSAPARADFGLDASSASVI